MVDPKDVLILNGKVLDGGMISTIWALVIEDIDDSIDELSIIGNDGKFFSLNWFCWSKDCFTLGWHQIPTWYFCWFHSGLLYRKFVFVFIILCLFFTIVFLLLFLLFVILLFSSSCTIVLYSICIWTWRLLNGVDN